MTLTPEIIIVTVADYFGVPIDKVLSTSRKMEFVKARQISMYLIRTYISRITLSKTAEYFPGKIKYKDHATVLFAEKKVKGYIETNRLYKEDIENLENKFGNNLVHVPTDEEIKEEILLYENKHLRTEILNLKDEISKLQSVIYGLKQSNKKFSKVFLQRQLNH